MVLWVAPLSFATLFSTRFYLLSTLTSVEELHENGKGFTSRQYQESEFLKKINSLPHESADGFKFCRFCAFSYKPVSISGRAISQPAFWIRQCLWREIFPRKECGFDHSYPRISKLLWKKFRPAALLADSWSSVLIFRMKLVGSITIPKNLFHSNRFCQFLGWSTSNPFIAAI